MYSEVHCGRVTTSFSKHTPRSSLTHTQVSPSSTKSPSASGCFQAFTILPTLMSSLDTSTGAAAFSPDPPPPPFFFSVLLAFAFLGCVEEVDSDGGTSVVVVGVVSFLVGVASLAGFDCAGFIVGMWSVTTGNCSTGDKNDFQVQTIIVYTTVPPFRISSRISCCFNRNTSLLSSSFSASSFLASVDKHF